MMVGSHIHWQLTQRSFSVKVTILQMNHMAGPQGPTQSRLYNKLCSVVNVALIRTRKAAIDSSHRDLRGAIFKPNFCFQSQCDYVY